jgi:CRP-like cAMP-binding protein
MLHSNLRNAPLFNALSDEQLTQILASSTLLKLREGEFIFEAGDRASRFYFLVSGQIKLYRLSPDGAEKVIELVSPGQTFAEALMFLERPMYPVSAAALPASQLIAFDNQNFLNILQGSIDSCFKIMGTLSQRIRGLIREIDDLTLQTATTRLCHMLWQQMDQAGSCTLELKIPKGILASRLSIQPETFSRILNSLSNQGIISVKRSSIKIINCHLLRHMANPEALVGLID